MAESQAMSSGQALSSHHVPAAAQAAQALPQSQSQQSSVSTQQPGTLQSAGAVAQAEGEGQHPMAPEVKVVVDEYLRQEKIGSEMLEAEVAMKAVQDMLADEEMALKAVADMLAEEEMAKTAAEDMLASNKNMLRWQAGELPEPGSAPAAILLILYREFQKPNGERYMTKKAIANRALLDLRVDLATSSSTAPHDKMNCVVDLEAMEWITRVGVFASHPADRAKYCITEAGAAIAQQVEEHRLQNLQDWPQLPPQQSAGGGQS